MLLCRQQNPHSHGVIFLICKDELAGNDGLANAVNFIIDIPRCRRRVRSFQIDGYLRQTTAAVGIGNRAGEGFSSAFNIIDALIEHIMVCAILMQHIMCRTYLPAATKRGKAIFIHTLCLINQAVLWQPHRRPGRYFQAQYCLERLSGAGCPGWRNCRPERILIALSYGHQQRGKATSGTEAKPEVIRSISPLFGRRADDPQVAAIVKVVDFQIHSYINRCPGVVERQLVNRAGTGKNVASKALRAANSSELSVLRCVAAAVQHSHALRRMKDEEVVF